MVRNAVAVGLGLRAVAVLGMLSPWKFDELCRRLRSVFGDGGAKGCELPLDGSDAVFRRQRLHRVAGVGEGSGKGVAIGFGAAQLVEGAFGVGEVHLPSSLSSASA